MKRTPQAKSQAAILVREMKAAGTPIKHQQALEMVAKLSGFRDWNAMSAAAEPPVEAQPALSNQMSHFDPSSQIAIVWSIDDVLEVRPDLTEDEAFDVLHYVKRKHDASQGISWLTIESASEWRFHERELHGTMAYTDNEGRRLAKPAIVKLKQKGRVEVEGGDLSFFTSSQEGEISFEGLPDEAFIVEQGRLFGTENEDDTYEQNIGIQALLEKLCKVGKLPDVRMD